MRGGPGGWPRGRMMRISSSIVAQGFPPMRFESDSWGARHLAPTFDHFRSKRRVLGSFPAAAPSGRIRDLGKRCPDLRRRPPMVKTPSFRYRKLADLTTTRGSPSRPGEGAPCGRPGLATTREWRAVRVWRPPGCGVPSGNGVPPGLATAREWRPPGNGDRSGMATAWEWRAARARTPFGCGARGRWAYAAAVGIGALIGGFVKSSTFFEVGIMHHYNGTHVFA